MRQVIEAGFRSFVAVVQGNGVQGGRKVATHDEQNVEPTEGGHDVSSGPAADVMDSIGGSAADLRYEVRSVLEAEKQPWRLRSTSGAVAEELIEAARAIAHEGGPSRTVVIVVGSDQRLAFSVPITLARQSGFPVVIVP
jgi:hypothetical protein